MSTQLTAKRRHSASPWRQENGVVYSAKNEFIMRPDHSTMGVMPRERASNLDLITSAPELLEWLEKAEQMARQQYDGGDDVPLGSAWAWLAENARNAITKATGGAS